MQLLNRLLLLLFIFSLSVSFSNCRAQAFTNPAEYMSYLFEDHPTYKASLWAYVKTAAHGKKAQKIEKRRNQLISTTAQIRNKVNRMVTYEGDASLRDALATYFDLNYHILKEDYGKIVDLEAIAEQSFDLMEAYLTAKEEANQRLSEAGDMLDEAQEVFAANHNINLIENETDATSQKLEKAGEVYDYYNDLFLIFFKSNKQESYLMEAVGSGDINALLQNQNTLEKYATEGIARLDTMRALEGDRSLVAAAKKVLVFYQKEAIDDVPVFAAFFLQKENLEKVKKAFEAKKERERTQQDVDRYNQAISDFNQAVESFNQTNESLNNNRKKLIEGWNQAVEAFLDQHVP
jgi:hypothetical protein